MNEPATLEPIVYDKVYNDEGKVIGLAVPKHELKRWNSGSRYPGTGQHAIRPTEPEESARDYRDVLAELEAWAIGDERLYAQLEELYEREPLIADKIAGAAVRGAQSGSLHDPTAFLASRLRPKK